MKMKGIQFFLLAMVAGLFLASCEPAADSGSDGAEGTASETAKKAPASTFAINAEGAEVMWTGSKEEGAHYGSFALTGGALMVSDGIDGGDATIDLTKMTVLDEEMDDEGKGKLAGHLSSEDFFNVAAHPNVSVAITGSEAFSGEAGMIPDNLPDPLESYFVTAPTHNIMAKLTIKGESHDITFPASIKIDGDNLAAMAFISFDRREYGLRFMSDTDANVNPTIHIGLKFNAAKQAS